MARILVQLDAETYRRLREQAQAEQRQVHVQAAWLLTTALRPGFPLPLETKTR